MSLLNVSVAYMRVIIALEASLSKVLKLSKSYLFGYLLVIY